MSGTVRTTVELVGVLSGAVNGVVFDEVASAGLANGATLDVVNVCAVLAD